MLRSLAAASSSINGAADHGRQRRSHAIGMVSPVRSDSPAMMPPRFRVDDLLAACQIARRVLLLDRKDGCDAVGIAVDPQGLLGSRTRGIGMEVDVPGDVVEGHCDVLSVVVSTGPEPVVH